MRDALLKLVEDARLRRREIQRIAVEVLDAGEQAAGRALALGPDPSRADAEHEHQHFQEIGRHLKAAEEHAERTTELVRAAVQAIDNRERVVREQAAREAAAAADRGAGPTQRPDKDSV